MRISFVILFVFMILVAGVRYFLMILGIEIFLALIVFAFFFSKDKKKEEKEVNE